MDGAFPWGWSPFGFWLSDQTAIVKDWLLLMMDVGTRAKIRPLLAALCGGANNGVSQVGWRYAKLSPSLSVKLLL